MDDRLTGRFVDTPQVLMYAPDIYEVDIRRDCDSLRLVSYEML